MYHQPVSISDKKICRGTNAPKSRTLLLSASDKARVIHGNQLGLTFVEVVMAFAVSAILLGSISASISQLFKTNSSATNQMSAVRQVQNAGYWVSHDTQMAQIISANTTGNGFPLILSWTEWTSGTVQNVTYSIANNQLKRNKGGNESIIANYIDPAQTTCNFTDNKLILTVTATVGSGPQTRSETRRYEVNPRSRL
jgi:hypothetical protein